MASQRTLSLKLLLAAMSIGLVQCTSRPVEWKVPTTYKVHDVRTPANRKALRDALEGKNTWLDASNRFDFREDAEGPPYEFTLNKVENMAQLIEVQEIIKEVTRKQNVPVDLRSAVLTFQSVEGGARTTMTIEVQGKATPGATVYLDIGTPELMIVPAKELDSAGKWNRKVLPNKLLGDRNGVIYGVAVKEGSRQYFRIPVFGDEGSQPIAKKDVPSESKLLLEVLPTLPQTSAP